MAQKTVEEYLGLGAKLGSGGHGSVYSTNRVQSVAKIIPIKKLPLARTSTNVECEYVGHSGDTALFDIIYNTNGKRVQVCHQFEAVETFKLKTAVQEISILRKTQEYSHVYGGRLVGYHNHQFVINSAGTLCSVVEQDKVIGQSVNAISPCFGYKQRVEMCAELLEAVDQFHSLGYVHLDIKPDNVMLSQTGVVLIDYSAAISANHAKIPDLEDIKLGVTGTRSSNSTFVGTPMYVAPEQARGRPCAQSDLYSAGLVIVELLDRYPFPELRSYGQETIERFLNENQLKTERTNDIVKQMQRSQFLVEQPIMLRRLFLNALEKLLDPYSERRKEDEFRHYFAVYMECDRPSVSSYNTRNTVSVDI